MFCRIFRDNRMQAICDIQMFRWQFKICKFSRELWLWTSETCLLDKIPYFDFFRMYRLRPIFSWVLIFSAIKPSKFIQSVGFRQLCERLLLLGRRYGHLAPVEFLPDEQMINNVIFGVFLCVWAFVWYFINFIQHVKYSINCAFSHGITWYDMRARKSDQNWRYRTTHLSSALRRFTTSKRLFFLKPAQIYCWTKQTVLYMKCHFAYVQHNKRTVQKRCNRIIVQWR